MAKAKQKKVEGVEMEDGDGVEEVDATAGGQRLIPGMEKKIVKKLVDFCVRHENTKAGHKNLTDQLTGENAEAEMLFRQYKQYFSEDENGDFVYEGNGVSLKISKPGKLKITTKVDDAEKAERMSG